MPSDTIQRMKTYVYRLIGAEISTTTRFCDACVQIAPQKHDTGRLLDAVECPEKKAVGGFEDVRDHRDEKDKRYAFLLNGNFNYLTDIQQHLAELHTRLSRHSRLFLVVYNPFLSLLYTLTSWLGIRKAPRPDVYLTEKDLKTFARLTGYELVRIRPCGFVPFPVPLLADLLNGVMAVIPIVNRFSFLWLVVLRPIIPETRRPSLSIVVPARNESGNIAAAVDRMPDFEGVDVELIFVEGNSTDDTWRQIQEVASRQGGATRITALQQPGKGKYDAVRHAFSRATGELVVILDADLTVPPERLPRFYEAYCEGLGDFVNGSRLVYPMENEAMRSINRVGNIVFCKLVAWIIQQPVTDTLCGTKLFPLCDYRRMVSWRRRFGDFDPFGDFEMLFSASELALGVIDVPVRYRARSYGETNIHRFRNGLQLLQLVVIGFYRILVGKTR